MKRVMMSFICVLMAAMVLLNGCVSEPEFSKMKINVPNDYSRSILNLQNASNLNATWKQWSERLMKSGFLDTSTVDDGTAVSIGKFAGANIIVTGRVDGEGNLRQLRLRALDTTTAQVVGTASERL